MTTLILIAAYLAIGAYVARWQQNLAHRLLGEITRQVPKRILAAMFVMVTLAWPVLVALRTAHKVGKS